LALKNERTRAGFGAEPGFIPEINLGASPFCPSRITEQGTMAETFIICATENIPMANTPRQRKTTGRVMHESSRVGSRIGNRMDWFVEPQLGTSIDYQIGLFSMDEGGPPRAEGKLHA
jgi:hypothetical protein